MRYSMTITMTYIGLGSNPDGSVTRLVDADFSKMNLSVIDDNGKGIKTISGSVTISKSDYDYFGLYLNDPSNYLVDPDYFTYTLKQYGVSLDTNKIKYTDNEIETKVLTFKLYDDITDKYFNILSSIENKHDIIGNVDYIDSLFSKVIYSDYRSISSADAHTTLSFTSQQDVNNYIDRKLNEDVFWIYNYFNFSTTGTPNEFDISYSTKFIYAYGHYDGAKRVPPCGINWKYNIDVSGKPLYVKKPKIGLITYPIYISSTSISDAVIGYEKEVNIDYEDVGYLLTDVIEYLIGQSDSSIIFNNNSFKGFDDVVGENFTAVSSSDPTKPFKNLVLMNISDFLPELNGTQKTNISTKGIISLDDIFNILKKIDFFWYIEEISGSFYFRIDHITTKTLAPGNPILTNYFNKDQTFKTRNITILDVKFDKIINSNNDSTIDFRYPEYIYRIGKKNIQFNSQNIHLDINYVIDAKDVVFDSVSDDQWVLMSTTFDGVSGPGDYVIRYFTSPITSEITNNYELSFYWLSMNIMEMPGKISQDGTIFNDNRIDKRQEITLDIPIKHIFTDFDFFGFISYFTKEAEISGIEQEDATKDICRLKLKLLHL